MKRKTAKELIAESFRELAEKKNIDKITVQEIVDNCGYSPATFYRHFNDKYDLIAWAHTRVIAAIMEQPGAACQWRDTLLKGAQWFYGEREYLINLFQHTSGQDSFAQYMVEINYNALKKYLLSVLGKSRLDGKEEMLVRTYCYGTVGLTCEWILGKYEGTPEMIAEIYEDALPSTLKKYLL